MVNFSLKTYNIKGEVRDAISRANFTTLNGVNENFNHLDKRIRNLENELERLNRVSISKQVPSTTAIVIAEKNNQSIANTDKLTQILYCEHANSDGVFLKYQESYKESYSLFKIELEQGASHGCISFLDTHVVAVKLGIAHKESTLKTVCEINEESLNPSIIVTTQVGKVVKTDIGWKILEKMKLILK